MKQALNQDIVAGIAQFNIQLGDCDANLQTALAALERLAGQGAQLVVLPEMWSTGYAYRQLDQLAQRTPAILTALAEVARRHQLVIVGSLVEQDGGRLYNSAYTIDAGALVGHYRKLHLFSTMGEDRFLAAGDRTCVVPTRLGRIGVAICYDLRFPELFRKMALEGAAIICLPAEWPKPRQEHWRTLLRARAIENQLFVAAANCCGVQGKLDFFGMSLLLSARGEVLAEAGEHDTDLIATFSAEEMLSYRSQIPCFRDRRPEIYGTLP
ncbi:MAG: carbon-nitrogen family hydrolase [Desulfuromonas sp.]|jgi:predicted amidohydrolase|uniref:carbon-nitrogen family hydrolase n=1 Tax=Desulfuromonas thiophila TaxID=57664 RepID=UPI0024A9175A|nr:carbon-nitrogen family hydrolase [Desulfuromonas thiophila]MCK9173365.1 carbon-nitrogen family hydrolase [Desulfuromonas thiophila]MDD3802710.1 carbon-nitrogen family hydrolase [Desulfuromonas thiophila]MDY0398031.1 carbon-nitrogen family hydrolase [Desulfuromonas thiophila]